MATLLAHVADGLGLFRHSQVRKPTAQPNSTGNQRGWETAP